jgi:hypothetical protein
VSVAVHVGIPDHRAVIAALTKRYARTGFELLIGESRGEPLVERVRVLPGKRWTGVVIQELETPDAWAKYLSKELAAPVLAAESWEDEPALELSFFDQGRKAGSVDVPRGARRDPDGRLCIPLGALSRLVAGAAPSADAIELRLRPGMADGIDELAERGFCRAFAIDELFPDPYLDEGDGDGIVLRFRPKPRSAVAKRLRAEAEAAEASLRAAYDARLFEVGWIALDAAPRAFGAIVDSLVRPLAEAFDPHLAASRLMGWEVAMTATERGLPDPAEGKRAFSAYAQALRDGFMIELRPMGAKLATVWAVRRDETLSIGWSMRGLRDDGRRLALSRVTAAIFDAAVDRPSCFGALITAQHEPTRLAQQALAYEYLRGRSAAALRTAWQRAHVRAPGFRVLVPREASRPAGKPPASFATVEKKAGMVIASLALEPFACTPTAFDALESWLAPALT